MRRILIALALAIACSLGIPFARAKQAWMPGAQDSASATDELCLSLLPQKGHEKLLQERQENLQEMIGILIERKLYEKAKTLAEEALRDDPDSAILYAAHGGALEGLGNLDGAIQSYTQAIARGERHKGWVYYRRGAVYAAKQEWARAIADDTEAIAIDPTNYVPYAQRAIAFQGTGDLGKARKDLEAARRVGPDGPDLQEWLGCAYDKLGDHDKAIECYTKAIQQGDKRLYALDARGRIYASRQDWTKAIADFTDAVTIKPANPINYIDRAKAYIGSGDVIKARKDLKTASAKGEDARSLQEYIGEAYRTLGDNDLALKFFTKAIENGNNQPWVLNRRGCIYAARQVWAPAIVDLTASIRLTPEQAEAYHYRGICYLAQRQYAEARADYEQACKRGGDDAGAYLLTELLARLSAAGYLPAGPTTTAALPRAAVIFPADKQKEVLMFFSLIGEIPDPIPHANPGFCGYPITVTFSRDNFIEAVQAKLTDAAGQEVPCWVSSPQEPANEEYAEYQGNTVCLIAKTQLEPQSKYTVLVTARVNGEPWSREWSFTTDSHRIEVQRDSDEQRQFAEQVLAEVNKERAAAGLNKVVLDDALSKGCFKHARYLATNEGRPEIEGLKAHQEDDKLPDSTKEGRKAGLNAVIVSGCNPGICVQVWMSTLYHRVPILDPKLKRIGFGFFRADKGHTNWVNVMDVGNGKQ